MAENLEAAESQENETIVENTLVHATKNGLREAVISKLTSNPEKINACADETHTPFELALQYGFLSMAADIVDLDGFDLDCEGHNPLRASIAIGAIQLAEKLLDKGANPNYYQEGLGTILLLAIESGFYPLAEKLIQKGAEVNFRDQRGWTALMYATFKGDKRTTEFLLDQGADPNIRNNDGWNAVVGAMATGHTEIVNLLMEHDGVFGEKYAQAAMVSCFKKGDYKLAIKLLESGINPNFSNGKDEPLLALALFGNHVEFAIALLDHGANPNTVTNNGWPVLAYAAEKGYTSIIQKIHDCGGDLNFTNGKNPPIIVATYTHQTSTIKLLASLGSEVNARDDDGDTALHIAAYREYEDLVSVLLSLKANPYLRNNKKRIPKECSNEFRVQRLL